MLHFSFCNPLEIFTPGPENGAQMDLYQLLRIAEMGDFDFLQPPTDHYYLKYCRKVTTLNTVQGNLEGLGI